MVALVDVVLFSVVLVDFALVDVVQVDLVPSVGALFEVPAADPPIRCVVTDVFGRL